MVMTTAWTFYYGYKFRSLIEIDTIAFLCYFNKTFIRIIEFFVKSNQIILCKCQTENDTEESFTKLNGYFRSKYLTENDIITVVSMQIKLQVVRNICCRIMAHCSSTKKDSLWKFHDFKGSSRNALDLNLIC